MNVTDTSAETPAGTSRNTTAAPLAAETTTGPPERLPTTGGAAVAAVAAGYCPARAPEASYPTASADLRSDANSVPATGRRPSVGALL